jgi:hypothetical protein
MATKLDAPHTSPPLLTLVFLSSLSRARLELLMTATIFICSLFLFLFFLALLESGIVQKFGFLRSLGVDSFHFGAFSRDTTSTFVQSLDLGYRLGYTRIGLEHGNFTFFSSPTVLSYFVLRTFE